MNWKEYCGTICVDNINGINNKMYIFYARNGKRFLRKYSKSVKNGLSLFDILEIKLKSTDEECIELINKIIFP